MKTTPSSSVSMSPAVVGTWGMVSLLALSAIGRLSSCGCLVCSLQGLKSADSLQIHEFPLIVAYPGNGGKTGSPRHDCPRTR
jgi:hypothetical protein